MIRVSSLFLTFALVTACTETPAPSATTEPPLDPSAIVSIEELPGQLVIIDETGNIAVSRPDGSDIVEITDDAGPEAVYAQPTWSNDGQRLIWSEATLESGVGVGISGAAGNERIHLDMAQPPFYFNWAPNDQTVGVLHNGDAGSIELQLVDVVEGQTRLVAGGAPLYFSWSPSSDMLAAHVGGEGFATLDLDGAVNDLGATSPAYPAPSWIPEGILHVSPRGLELIGPGGEGRILGTAPGPLALVANSTGTRIATQVVTDDSPDAVGVAYVQTPTLPTNKVLVVDLATGEIETITERLSVGFSWSPDGEALLIIEPTTEQGSVALLVWRDGELRRLGVISPHPRFVREVLLFFDQYAQSHSLWSPDSNAVVFPGAVDGDPGIWVYLLNEEEPAKAGEGSWVVWSGP
jgi:TolB protein